MTTRQLSPENARIIGDALFAMARADGDIDPREVKVIEQFLADCASKVASSQLGAITPASLRTATEGLTDSFLSACALLAFADGDFTGEEAVLLRRYATACDVPERRLQEIVDLAQQEQPADVSAAASPLGDLNGVLGSWSRQHMPALRAKVERLLLSKGPR